MDITISRSFRVTFNDPNVWQRCVGNEDGWRDRFYDLRSINDVAYHLAYQIGELGWKLSHLDGWADLPDDAVTVEETTSGLW